MALLDQFGHPLPPVSTSRMTARASRDAGAYRGSISGWRGPQVHSPEGESRERDVMQRRAADLAANYPSVTAIIEEVLRLRAELERMEREADWLAREVNLWERNQYDGTGEHIRSVPELRRAARKAVKEEK